MIPRISAEGWARKAAQHRHALLTYGLRSRCTTTTIACPHVISDEDGNGGHPESGECEAEIVVELEWTPGERYGQDADGNRGVWQPGYFSVAGIANTCQRECEMDESDWRIIEQRAEQAADDYTNQDHG